MQLVRVRLDNDKFICFRQTQEYFLFNLMATSFGHYTIIKPSLHKI